MTHALSSHRALSSPSTLQAIVNIENELQLSQATYLTELRSVSTTKMSDFNFYPKDCRAIITGGSQGLGLEFARRLVSLGTKVCICDIDSTAGQSAVQELREQYGIGADW